MIEERATVIEVSDGYIGLEIEHRSTCVGCHARLHCKDSMLSAIYRPKLTWVQAPSYIFLQPGDKIVISIDDGLLLRGALLVYLLPLALLLFGVILVQVLFSLVGECALIFSGIIGILVGFLMVRKLSWWCIKHEKYQHLILIRLCW
jgi:sigma-E factor negative regulatory protein RseC